MMRALAAYVMKGPRQAATATLLLGLLPLANLLSPALVGLVVLRRGIGEGAKVLVWAILPVGGWFLIGDTLPLVVMAGVVGLAALLRETRSWELALVAALLIAFGMDAYLRMNVPFTDQLLGQVEALLAVNPQVDLEPAVAREWLIGGFASAHMVTAVLMLMLARSLQAALFNPGGFRDEFHALRLSRRVAPILLGLMALVFFAGVAPLAWLYYLAVPLLVAGIGLVHGLVRLRRLSGGWLVAFYLAMLLPMLVQLVVALAAVDSWYDFRRRVGPA